LGAQFTSWAFTRRALDSGLLPSLGSIGDWYHNAVIEAFWSRMQVELLNRKRWSARVELANAIFEYLENLPQPPAPTLRAWHAHTRRVRSRSSTRDTRHEVHPADSTELRAPQSPQRTRRFRAALLRCWCRAFNRATL
jgi:hypothetical protein